jgi:hypothetical protein
MQDIKFIGTDGDFLLLETADGVRYRLLLDDAVRRASRGENSTQLDAPNLSPREIQEEIRAGRSIQDIVTASGAPEEYVRKFAQPVLDELNHAVLNALMVRLEIAGDRFNEPTAREFGEIIKSRLAASGAGIERWSALKAPVHGFFIYCEFELNGETKKATWSYDPKRLALSPENDVAITLSSQDRLAAQAPKLRPVATTATSVTESLGETVDLVRSIPTHSTPLNSQASEPDQPALSETADLLDALRKKRNERESVEQLEPHPSTEGLRIVELVPEQTSPNEEEDLDVIEPESAPAPVDTEGNTVPKRGRASIPSWDQIVFGTKTED